MFAQRLISTSIDGDFNYITIKAGSSNVPNFNSAITAHA
jgi:hypothetical protein